MSREPRDDAGDHPLGCDGSRCRCVDVGAPVTAHRCRFCHHLPHPDGRCGVKSVTGPAVNTNAGSGYCPEDHTGRTVTRCGCTDYLPTLNGVSPL